MKIALPLVALLLSHAAFAAGEQWIPLKAAAPGTPQLYYSPSTAKIEGDRGAKVRSVDIKAVAADGAELRETWKVHVSQCTPLPRKYVDVSIYSNGKFQGVQRGLSLTNTRLESTKMARAACGLPVNL